MISERIDDGSSSKLRSGDYKTFKLGVVIDDDQRAYIDGIRMWLKDSMERKEEIFKGIC
jgi:hypothetical protein